MGQVRLGFVLGPVQRAVRHRHRSSRMRDRIEGCLVVVGGGTERTQMRQRGFDHPGGDLQRRAGLRKLRGGHCGIVPVAMVQMMVQPPSTKSVWPVT